jgi:hypothetical protein
MPKKPVVAKEIEKYWYHPSGRIPMKGRRGYHFGYRAAVAEMEGKRNTDKPLDPRKLKEAEFKTFRVGLVQGYRDNGVPTNAEAEAKADQYIASWIAGSLPEYIRPFIKPV